MLSVVPDMTHSVVLRRPGRPQQVVSGITVSDQPLPYVAGDASGLMLTNDSGNVWTLDLESGSAAVVLRSSRNLRVYATPSRFFAVEGGYNTVDDVVHWWERDGSGLGQVLVAATPDGRDYVPFGERLASLRAEDSWRVSVQPVNLTTGARDATILTTVLAVRLLGTDDWRLWWATPATDGWSSSRTAASPPRSPSCRSSVRRPSPSACPVSASSRVTEIR